MSIDKLKVFFENLKSFHHRIMMRFLRKRDWVVFYLEPKHRICKDGMCWLELYKSQTQDIPADIDPEYEAARADLIPNDP